MRKREYRDTSRYIVAAAPQQGSVMLFAIVVFLPLMFFLLTFTVDLDMAHTRGESAQQFADSAALYAYRFLPDQAAARKAAELYLAQRSDLASHAQIIVTRDDIQISVKESSPLWFMKGLSMLLPGGSSGADTATASANSSKLESLAFTGVKGVPLDLFILLDRSSYLAPALRQGSAPWGDRAAYAPVPLFTEKVVRYDENGVQIDPTLLMQHCFNPYFSALKEAALQTYHRARAFALNGVGVGFFPSGASEIETASEISLGVQRNSEQLQWPRDVPTAQGLQNRFCIAVSESGDRFTLPKLSQWQGGATREKRDLLDYDLEPRVATLSAPELIWGQVVRDGEYSSVTGLFSELNAKLINVGYESERGVLQSHAISVGMIFLGGMPRAGGRQFPNEVVQEQIRGAFDLLNEKLKSKKIRPNLHMKLFFILPVAAELDIDERKANTLKKFLEELQSERVEIKVFTVKESEKLAQSALLALGSINTAMVSQ